MFCACFHGKSNLSASVPHIRYANEVWKEFINSRMPVICITGPNLSGKTSLARYLSDHSNFRLLNARGAIHSTYEVLPHSKDIVNILRNEIINSSKFCSGYIIDDFPPQMAQFRKFEKQLHRPIVIIYISMSLDACLSRSLIQNPTVDLNAVRIAYVKTLRFAERLYHSHEKKKKAIKILSQYPIHETHVRALEILENEYSYKFRRTVKRAS